MAFLPQRVKCESRQLYRVVIQYLTDDKETGVLRTYEHKNYGRSGALEKEESNNLTKRTCFLRLSLCKSLNLDENGLVTF